MARCPACGSDDLDRVSPAGAPVISVACLACGHRFDREPDVSCPRCHSRNVASRSYLGWAYDDAEQARDDPAGAAWSSYDREDFRCLNGNRTWRASGPARPHQG